MKLRTVLVTTALFALAAQPVFAHRFWIIPSSSTLSGEKPWITVDAAISNSLFFPDHAAPAVEWFTVTGPDAKEVPLQNASKGRYRTTFDVELAVPGTYKIATVRSFLFASWEEGGETKRWRGTAADFAKEGLKGKPGLELSRTESRVETFVTAGDTSEEVLKPTGKGLELVLAKNHPNDLFSGEKATFILHKDGVPAAGAKILFIKGDGRYRDDAGEVKITAGEDGSFQIEPKEAGRYWLSASTEGKGSAIDGIETPTRYSYTATFEVLPQ